MSARRRPAGCSRLAALLCLCGVLCTAQDDEFEWFRCDACSAAFFKINKTLVDKLGSRQVKKVPGYEFMEIIEEICDTMFTKHEFGVKQYEGKKYLFGPGVTDHIPDKGFGQMGMGDYDKRLAAYCKMFVEDEGEERIQELFAQRGLNHTELCARQCRSSASGTGAQSENRRPRKRPAPRPTPPADSSSGSARKKGPRPKKAAAPAGTKTEAAQGAGMPQPPGHGSSASSSAGAGAAAGIRAETGIGQVLDALPKLSTPQLQQLGSAVMAELAARAHPAAAAAARSNAGRAAGEL